MSAIDADFPSDLRTLERDYELIRELGQGGMAAVYLARSRATGQLVAIKAIRARYRDDPDTVRRFAREAATVAGLDHPNIVRTLAIEQIDDRAVAIIMEHVPGGTVRDWLREHGSLGAEHAESVLRDVASALAYAHRRGIVHRDVKPENIFLDAERGRAVLSDFGIARDIRGDSSITLLGSALGTPQYMSPEQIDGEIVDGRSDIYSLGVLGWELLTGRRPWAGDSLYGVIYKQKHEDLPRITLLRPRVPANLLFAIEGALVKDKTKRWQTADEFLDRLTYNPPPVLSQTYPPAAQRASDEPTVFFRSSALAEGVAPEGGDALPPPDAVDVGAPPDVGEDASRTRAVVSRERLPVVRESADEFGVADAPQPLFANANYAFPEFDPHAEMFVDRRRLRRSRALRAAGFVVPLGVAAATLYVVLGGSMIDSRRRTDGANVTASTGSIAPDARRATDALPARQVPAIVPNDSARRAAGAGTADSEPARPNAEASTVVPPTPGLPPRAATGSPRRVATEFDGMRAGASTTAVPIPPESIRDPGPDGAPRIARATDTGVSRRPEPARAAPAAADVAKPDSEVITRAVSDTALTIEDPFKIPASSGDSTPGAPGPVAALGTAGPVPSSRCLIASTAAQRSCLSAYVAAGDIPLQRTFDELVAEMRRAAGTPDGALDPPSVERLRVEQRVWLSVREQECPRVPPPGAPPFWAKALAQCFNEMAAARTADLRQVTQRLKRRR